MNKEKKKILLLPTYWPTNDAPIIGSQVKEQAELLINDFDLKALYCLPGMGWKRLILILFFGRFIKNRLYKKCDHQLLGGKIESRGVYFFKSNCIPEKLNQYFKNKAYKYVFDLIRSEKWEPKLMHSRGFDYGGTAATYLSKYSKIPFVNTENTMFLFDIEFSKNKLKNYKNVLQQAKAIHFVSHFLLRNTVMHGFLTQKPLHVIANPVDEDHFYLCKERKEENPFRILITGYNAYIKDYPTYFKTLKTLVEKGISNLQAVVVLTYGNDKNKDEILQLASQYGFGNLCEIHLQVSRDAMPSLVNTCDLYLCTSLIETFGIATLESMFCGVPVVSTRNGGIEDFINADNGILCNIGDYNELASAVEDVIKGKIKFDPDRVRESVVNKYGKKAFTQKLRELYLNTIAENN